MAKSGWDKWKEKKAREAKRELKKSLKKTNRAYIIIAVIALVIGFAGSYFGFDYICKNDAFELVGEKEFVFTVGADETYNDEGIKYISLGRDCSKSVKAECDVMSEDGSISVKALPAGEYPIIYTAVGGRCDGQTLYRVIKIVEAEEG